MTFLAIKTFFGGVLGAMKPWMWWALILITTGVVIDVHAHMDQEAKDKQKRKDDQAKADAKISKTVTTIQETRTNDAQRADKAVRNMPVAHSLDELRHADPAAADELFGPADR